MALCSLPGIHAGAFAVWYRNFMVWKKLIGPAMLMNFGEPALYLLALGYGLGFFIGEMGDMPYLVFLASGIVASSAMTTASFEGTYSVFTRMVPQRTYEAMLTTPLQVNDILAGEMLWCASKSVVSASAILVVAALLGLVSGWQALWVLPIVFLVGLSFAGPAIIMSVLASNYDFFSYYTVLVITPMYLLSGVFYPIDTLPPVLHTFLWYLPLPHAVALTRPLVTGRELTDVFLHLGVLALYAGVSYCVAVHFVRRKLIR
jgi:lipooligosaccharide transport system permease protein